MNQQRNSSVRRWISNLLFVVAAALFAYVAFAWYQERNDTTGQAPTPQSVPGRAELKTVHDALASQGMTVEYGRQTVRIEGLTPVGQQLIVDGAPAYVFIFESPETRTDQIDQIELDAIELKTPSGANAATAELHSVSGSNVLVVSDGASDDIQQKIESGVGSLP
ncbi:MAG: hypothetical protein M9947_05755 [Thermomicrobiales bacterium]|nr:hypothetical protein [Thermomicrobiales bacterium]